MTSRLETIFFFDSAPGTLLDRYVTKLTSSRLAFHGTIINQLRWYRVKTPDMYSEKKKNSVWISVELPSIQQIFRGLRSKHTMIVFFQIFNYWPSTTTFPSQWMKHRSDFQIYRASLHNLIIKTKRNGTVWVGWTAVWDRMYPRDEHPCRAPRLCGT